MSDSNDLQEEDINEEFDPELLAALELLISSCAPPELSAVPCLDEAALPDEITLTAPTPTHFEHPDFFNPIPRHLIDTLTFDLQQFQLLREAEALLDELDDF